MIARCCCTDSGCPATHGSYPCRAKASVALSRVDFTPGVYDLPMCETCAADALESGVFAAAEGDEGATEDEGDEIADGWCHGGAGRVS